MIKNILTIDLDYLFVELFPIAKLIDPQLTPKQSWKVINWKVGLKQMKMDKDTYCNLIEILKEKCSSVETVLIEKHVEILEVMRQRNVKDARLFNMDNHHDLGYKPILDWRVDETNWVPFARLEGLIKEYNWIRQDNSEYPINPQIQYYSASWKDMKIENYPKFDLVVICKSPHYTHPSYWKFDKEIQRKIMCYNSNKYKYFMEIPLELFPKVNKADYPNYWVDQEVDPERIFKYEDFYIGIKVVDQTPYISMINLGKAQSSLFHKGDDLIDDLIEHYGKLGFVSKVGFRNEAFIKRIAKKYILIDDFERDEMKHIIITKEENI